MDLDAQSCGGSNGSLIGVRVEHVADELGAILVTLPQTPSSTDSSGYESGEWRSLLRCVSSVCATHMREHASYEEKVRKAAVTANDLDGFVELAAKRCGLLEGEPEMTEDLIVDWGLSTYLEWAAGVAICASSEHVSLRTQLRGRLEDLLSEERVVPKGGAPVDGKAWDRGWRDYVAVEQRRFSEVPPALDYSLEQVYIDLRAVYLAADNEQGEGVAPERVGVKLCEHIRDWLLSEEEKHHKLAVIGARGMGKSTFSTVFVAKHALELREQGCVVITLPVDQLQLNQSVEDALSAYCLRQSKFGFSAVDPQFLKQYQVLLLLDGVQHLDERSNGSEMEGSTFVRETCLMADRLNSHIGSTRMHVAFVGMPSIAKHHAETFRGKALLEILPFSPSGMWKAWWPKQSEGGFMEVDQNEQWWDKWRRLTGGALEDPRSMIQAKGAESLTCRPFFNDLIAYAYQVAGLAQAQAHDLSALYQHVSSFLMGKFAGHQAERAKEYLLCLEEVAVWRWHGTTWDCDTQTLRDLLNDSEYLTELLGAQVDLKLADSVAKMARTFFKEDQLLELSGGIQKFLFWDYLIAVRILRVTAAIVSREAGVALEKKLHEWTALTAFAPISESTYFFMSSLMREKLEALGERERCQWQSVFSEMFGHAVQHDVPIHKVMKHADFGVLRAGAFNAETSIAIVLGQIAQVTERVSAVEWSKHNQQELGSWLMRMNGQRVDYISSSISYGVSQLLPTPMLLRSLNYLNFTGQALTVQNLSSANLKGAVLSRVRMSRSSFRYAEMAHAQMDHSVMRQVTMDHAHLNHASFDHSDLSEARMQKCAMHGASFIRAKLNNVDLTDSHAGSCVFSWADLSNALLERTRLDQSRMNGAVLSNCSIQNSWLLDCSLDEVVAKQVSFRHCELRGSSMVNAVMNQAFFSDSGLERVGMFRAECEGAEFQKCQMAGVNLEKANLRGASLQACAMEGASLNGADLSEATVSASTNLNAASMNEATLSGTLFHRVDLERVSFEQARIDAKTKWVDCNLRSADFNGVHLDGVTMTGNTLERSNFIAASLIRADLTQAKLGRALMDRCQAEGAIFKQADLSAVTMFQADLRDADLSAATLHGVNLHGATLDGANLIKADLQGASLFGASLEGADLRGANLEGANLFGANFEKVKIEMDQLSDEQRGQIRGTPEWIFRNDAMNAVFRRDSASLDSLKIVEQKEEVVVVNGEVVEVVEEAEVVSSEVNHEEAGQ
ncbi:pentapeptide repeat-containing protein [Rubritalea marina]|uniref:pentapeptide repeat-containing protein n=1 Tax=Rubritalea marina TaxID=361055 RepID=UPI0003761931|nr:pentapeptide repeat-containing protein [Rubritalea marina]